MMRIDVRTANLSLYRTLENITSLQVHNNLSISTDSSPAFNEIVDEGNVGQGRQESS